VCIAGLATGSTASATFNDSATLRPRRSRSSGTSSPGVSLVIAAVGLHRDAEAIQE
jgi:hypothetical protein